MSPSVSSVTRKLVHALEDYSCLVVNPTPVFGNAASIRSRQKKDLPMRDALVPMARVPS
jgi:hypothetical protein